VGRSVLVRAAATLIGWRRQGGGERAATTSTEQRQHRRGRGELDWAEATCEVHKAVTMTRRWRAAMRFGREAEMEGNRERERGAGEERGVYL